MTKGVKIALIGLGIVGVGTVVGLVIRNKNKDAEERRKRREQQLEEKELGEATRTEGSGLTSSGYIIPKRNRNDSIVNPLSEVKGRMLYPASNTSKPILGYKGAVGTANLRSSAEVNTGWWNNLITKISGRTQIGKVIGAVNDNLDPPMRWFRVEIQSPALRRFYKVGYVRADVVTFNKYKSKSSSFNGDMIEHYAPDPLGANVFPHSNWMLPSTQYYSAMDGKDFELDEALTDLD